MYCYQGKERFCSILLTSQKPENVKTTLEKYLLGDPENSELSFFFFLIAFFFFFEMMNKCEFQGRRGSWKEKKNGLTLHVPHISWSDTILREISTFSSAFPKGQPAMQPDWHQPVRCKLGHPGAPLMSFYLQVKWQASTARFPSCLHSSGSCFASSRKQGPRKHLLQLEECCSHWLCWRPPLPQAHPQKGPNAHMWTSAPSKPPVTTLKLCLGPPRTQKPWQG